MVASIRTIVLPIHLQESLPEALEGSANESKDETNQVVAEQEMKFPTQ